MNILSRFLVVLTLLVVSWGWLGLQNPESADISSLTSPSSSVLVANAPSNNTPDNHLVTELSPKLEWNTSAQKVQTYPGMYQAQVALIMNNEPVEKVEELLNVSAMMRPHWAMMKPWGGMRTRWAMMMSRWSGMMPRWAMMMPRWGGMMPRPAMMLR